MKTAKEWFDEDQRMPLIPKKYTLEQAIDRLGKEGWNILGENEGWKLLHSIEYGWYFEYPTDCYPKNFPTALEQLKAAIEACILLNGATN
jgi:hypothetical protein